MDRVGYAAKMTWNLCFEYSENKEVIKEMMLEVSLYDKVISI